ncbi:MAG: radical SAM protein [Acidobacteriota bacterium]
MLTGLHLLLTYKCTFECDHCFVYSSPSAQGTFTFEQVCRALDQAVSLGSILEVYFEGGEPFLYYPLMVEGAREARKRGFEVGVVTNAYFATSEADAALWLRPLVEIGIFDLSISEDSFHAEDEQDNPGKRALAAALRQGLPATSICIERPAVEPGSSAEQARGAPVTGGKVKFRGRAVQKLSAGVRRRLWDEFTECPYEDLASPERVHVDAYGNVHLCQGLLMGNMWETPLPALVSSYEPSSHPLCGPLLRGGPAELARACGAAHEDGYIDACHLCYDIRKALIEAYPRYLGPRQVYGLD